MAIGVTEPGDFVRELDKISVIEKLHLQMKTISIFWFRKVSFSYHPIVHIMIAIGESRLEIKAYHTVNMLLHSSPFNDSSSKLYTVTYNKERLRICILSFPYDLCFKTYSVEECIICWGTAWVSQGL